MKFMTFTVIATGISVLVLTAGCGKTLQERIKQAEGSAPEEKRTLEQSEQDAQLEYLDEWSAFRSAAEEQLASNAKSIDDLKLRLAKSDDEVKAKVGSQIEALTAKNSELQKRLDSYRDEGKLNWDAFKRDFSHDLDGLGKTLKDLTTDNK